MKLIALFIIAALSPLCAATVTLYDATGNQAPSAFGWTLAGFGSFTESIANDRATLTTAGTPDLNRAGYSRLTPFSLDRNTGYELTFDLRLLAESHQSNDRAGLSLTIIGNDLLGIELGFWTDRIWAQNEGATKPPRFTQAESAAFDTTQRTIYRLLIRDSTYLLSAGNTTILTGALRNYSPEGLPYSVTNFLFVGDNSTSASATTEWYAATLSDIPEPSTALLCAAAVLLLAALRSSKLKQCAVRSNASSPRRSSR